MWRRAGLGRICHAIYSLVRVTFNVVITKFYHTTTMSSSKQELVCQAYKVHSHLIIFAVKQQPRMSSRDELHALHERHLAGADFTWPVSPVLTSGHSASDSFLSPLQSTEKVAALQLQPEIRSSAGRDASGLLAFALTDLNAIFFKL